MVALWVRTHQERGSALVEFTLLMGVLLPIGFGMSMLGKLTDLKQTAEQASRYTTWEATVYSRSQLSAQASSNLDTRFFEMPDAQILSTTQQNKSAKSENPLWGESTGHSSSLRELASVSRNADHIVASHYAFDTGKAKAARVTGEIVATAGQALSDFSGNSWGIVADGLLRSSVEIAVKPTRLLVGATTPCGTADLSENTPASTPTQADRKKVVCVKSAGSILADGWAASSEAQAMARVRSLVPASTMQRVGEGVGKLLGSIVFPELDPLDKAFGHVDMRVLPEYARP